MEQVYKLGHTNALGIWFNTRGWTIGIRFPARAGNISLLHRVQTGSVANPAPIQ